MPAFIATDMTLRPATRDDGLPLARLAVLASEGLTSYLWARAEPGADPLAVGTARAARDEGAFSWRNATLVEVGGVVAGGLLTWRIPDAPEPLDGLPPMFRPLQALENRAPGSQYVNMLATFEAFRGRGVGTALLAEAARLGRDAAGGMSLIVADGNAPARRLYRAVGYDEVASEPIVREGWTCDSEAWILMVRR